jgi:hypothetical protein
MGKETGIGCAYTIEGLQFADRCALKVGSGTGAKSVGARPNAFTGSSSTAAWTAVVLVHVCTRG